MNDALWSDVLISVSSSAFVTGLLFIALKGALLLAAAWFTTALLQQSSASTRHFIWTLALGGALLLPVATLLMPGWRVAILPSRWDKATTPVVAPSASPSRKAIEPVEPTLPARAGVVAAALNQVAAAPSSVRDPADRRLYPVPNMPTAVDVRSGFTSSQGVLGLWLLGGLLSLLPLVRGRRAVARLAQQAREVTGGPWQDAVRATQRAFPLRRSVVMLESDASPMPMTWGILHPVVLLPAGDLGWSAEQRRAALRHELAHVARHDCLTQLIARVTCAVYWFNPLVWIAARQLRIERELACDDDVLSSGTCASDYATQLLNVARTLVPAPATGAAALSMARHSQMGSRLRAILDSTRTRTRLSVRRAFVASVTAVALVTSLAAFAPVSKRVSDAIPSPELVRRSSEVVTPATASGVDLKIGEESAIDPVESQAAVVEDDFGLLPAIGQGTCDTEPGGKKGSSSHTSRSDNGARTWEVRWKRGDCSFEVDARGTLTFNGEATDVQAISRGGHFELEQRDGNQSHRVRITPNDDGTLNRVYWLNGDKRPFDADAAKWFAGALIALDRRTAFAADSRLPVILRRGGVPAALDEIALVDPDHAQRVYYSRLIELQPLTTAQLREILTRVASTFESDYEKAQLLLQLTKLPTFTDDAHAEFLTAAGGIDSDYEMRRVLSAMLGRADLRPSNVKGLLDAARGLDSDYELAELLISVSKRYGMKSDTRPVYLDALASLDSDYEHRRVLMAVLKGGDVTPSLIEALLTDGARLESDYERGEFLLAVAASNALEPTSYDTYFRIVDAIGSDYEHRRVLEALIRKQEMSRELAERIIRSAAAIESDYECATLLVNIARVVPIDERLRPVYEKAAGTIGSEHEYGRAMAALRRKANL